MPATYEPIATATLSTAGTDITFSSIPNSYTDLRLILRTQFNQSISSGTLRFYYNSNNTSSLFSTTTLYGDGGTIYTNRRTVENTVRITELLVATNIPIFAAINVFSYAGGTHKTALIETSYDANGSNGGVDRSVSLWRSTSAINAITINAGVNMNAGTTATLYGILKA